jgi:hypothetical protein
MSDYFVWRTIVLKQQAAPSPVGPAISALQQANLRLEQSMPRQQPVPAYHPTKTAEVRADARAHSGE